MRDDKEMVLNRRTRDDIYSKKKIEEEVQVEENFNSNPRRPRKVSGAIRILFFANLFLEIIFLLFLFIKGIFPISIRLLALVILGFFQYRLYKKIFIKRENTKILSNIFMIVSIIFTISFMYLFAKLDSSIARMNKNQIEVNSDSRVGYAFNIYISGIDTSGDIGEVSRSDVNIIASINTKTGKIMLTSVPRDSYLPIAEGGNNQYDKLTHAGIYGVTSSVKTLENAFDISIPYFAKVNFDSLINLVDVLDGVTVDNPQEFVSVLDGKTYPKGKIKLDGKMALSFVRERYNLQEGDLDRGRNQERVIAAIIKKMFSPVSLVKMDDILKVLEQSIDTNIQTSKAMEIANSQMVSFGKDNIESVTLMGEGAYGLPSYAMPDYNLFMYVPYESSIKEIREKIINLLSE